MNMPPFSRFFILCTAFSLPLIATAQQVYRCEVNGKIGYSHEPCVGAKAIDTTPTQGMDKMTGKSQKGADVRRDEFRREISGVSSQITGLSAETHMRLAQRYKLSRSAQLECATWDARLPGLEEAATTASPQDKERADTTLFKARKAFRDLRC